MTFNGPFQPKLFYDSMILLDYKLVYNEIILKKENKKPENKHINIPVRIYTKHT